MRQDQPRSGRRLAPAAEASQQLCVCAGGSSGRQATSLSLAETLPEVGVRHACSPVCVAPGPPGGLGWHEAGHGSQHSDPELPGLLLGFNMTRLAEIHAVEFQPLIMET